MTRGRNRWGRGLAGLMVVAAGSVLGATPALASSNQPVTSTSVAPGVSVGPPQVTLLSQTPWVESGQTFRLRLQISSAHPASDQLVINAYGRLTTRTDFDNAAGGRYNSGVAYSTGPLVLAHLTRDSAGGVDVNIPVNPTRSAGGSSGPPAFQAQAGSGVFPLQVGLQDSSGQALGVPITTFLVYAAGPPSVTNLPRLSVAVVVPVHSDPNVGRNGQLEDVSTSESQRLASLAAVLAGHSNVPVTLDATPQTIYALNSGSATDRATVVDLSSLVVGGPDELLSGPYARVSFSDLFGSGLGSELGQQLGAGATELSRALGQAPDRSAYVFDGNLDQLGLNALTARGVNDVVVPADNLTPVPASAATQTTFAVPTALADPGGPKVTVYAADGRLTADFVTGEPDVLAANQLLAELAMIQLETPGVTRGVVVLPPVGWVADPTFVATLLAGLAGHPLLAPVTVSGLFGAVQPAPVERALVPGSSSGSGSVGGSGSLGNQGVVSQAGSEAPASAGSSTSGPTSTVAPPAPSLVGVAPTIRADRRAVSGLASVLTNDSQGLATSLQGQLLTAESTDLTGSQRDALLGAVTKAARRVIGQISLPGASSITLTSTKSRIPLTIRSALAQHARVRLQLSSQRLIFQPFSPSGGRCQVIKSTNEVCDLTLSAQNTTLKIPVETRSSGVFPIEVELYSPDGSQLLAKSSDTVRSTAISGVGIVLIVLAVLSLAIWWVRDLRHGRRARQLVPVPGPDDESVDPVVDAFFAQPPPRYRGDGNGAAPGPSRSEPGRREPG